jgi:hypothetical protein
MAEVTLLEAAKSHQDVVERSVAKIIVENSPILEYIPFKTINGAAYRYHREASLGAIAFRGVGGTYTPDAGVINPMFEPLVIMGGEVKLDNFEVATMGNLLPLKSDKYRMKARQAGFKFSETFFEGDSSSDLYSFDGLRKRILVGGSQAIEMGTNGLALTVAKLDEALDAVVGDNADKIIFMAPQTRRELTALVRGTTGSGRIEYTQDAFGKQQMAYANAPIRVIRREDDGSSYFGYDETQGSSNVTASLYIVRPGMDYLHGIQSGGLPSVKDFGEVPNYPAHLGRIEWYCGVVVKHPRAICRLHGILAA